MRSTLAAAAILLASTVSSQAIDFTQVLIDDDGCPIRDEIAGLLATSPPAPEHCGQIPRPLLTLGLAVFYALRTNYPDEKPVTGDMKFSRGDLASLVKTSTNYVPSSEEITLMKDVVARLYTPGVVAVAYPMLDPSIKRRGPK